MGGFVKGVISEPPPPPLPTNAGMNRYVWNLRHERFEPVSDTIRYVSMRPYRVSPGTYRARLNYNGNSVTESFRVLPDPRREPITASAWAHQQQLLGEMAALVNDVHDSTTRMRSIAEQATRIMETTGSYPHSASIVAQSQQLVDRISAWEIQVPQPQLADDVQDRIAFPSRLLSTQILHLMGAIDQDPPVSAGSEQRSQELNRQWTQIRADMQDILDNDLHQLNMLLKDDGVPHIAAPAGR